MSIVHAITPDMSGPLEIKGGGGLKGSLLASWKSVDLKFSLVA
jgi:hypothetical protein